MNGGPPARLSSRPAGPGTETARSAASRRRSGGECSVPIVLFWIGVAVGLALLPFLDLPVPEVAP